MTSYYERDMSIERIAAEFNEAGLNGGPIIVYRDSMRVGLALAVLAQKKFSGEVKATCGGKLGWCVIGTAKRQDNDGFRAIVTTLTHQLEKLKP